jgi:opacity protein-like surface antigen
MLAALQETRNTAYKIMKTKAMNSHTPAARRTRTLAPVLAALALAAAASSAALAQTAVPTPQSVAPNYRLPQTGMASQQVYHFVEPHANTWDFYLTVGGWFIDSTNMNARHVRIDRSDFADGNIKIKFSDSFSFGFGVGYNITEQLSVHGMFAYSNPDYDATFTVSDPLSSGVAPGEKYRVYGSADITTGDLAIRYDFIPGKIRPFVQGSLGFMYIDTGIANGLGSWWWGGYWDGYYRDTPTVTHTYFTLGASAGLNYYFTDHLFASASYTANWANTPHTWMLNQRIGVSIGWNL